MTKKSRNLRKNLMNPTRKKRIFNILIVLLFSISGISMILYSLNTNLDYFFTPSELNEKELSSSKRIKIGGMVLSGSVKRDGSEISFVITDYENSINVIYQGIVPDLFKEDSGVVALGYLRNDIFEAEEVLAKHDERIEQSIKSDELIIKMIDEIKDSNEKNYQIIHGRIDKIQEEIKSFSKFRWQIGGVLIVAALLIGAGSRLAPFFLTAEPQQVIIERQK